MTILSDVILDLTERGYSISFSPHKVFPEDITLIKMVKDKHRRDNTVSKIELDYYKIDRNEYLCEKIKTMAAEIMQEEIDSNKYLCEKIKSIAAENMQEEGGERKVVTAKEPVFWIAADGTIYWQREEITIIYNGEKL